MRKGRLRILLTVVILISFYSYADLQIRDTALIVTLTATHAKAERTADGTFIIMSRNFGRHPNITANGYQVVFLSIQEMREIANGESRQIKYHHLGMTYWGFGYNVVIDHLTMFPKGDTGMCWDCSGHMGFVAKRNGEWVWISRGTWET